MAPKDSPVETTLELKLPVMASSPADIGRLMRELESIDEALLQLGIREPGNSVKIPKTSKLLDEIAAINKLNLLQEDDRKVLHGFLQTVSKKSPIIHMSFSADPNAAFIEKIMIWLRREIHPSALLTIGLQPNIGAGCIVRTTNKYFDFSLKQNFSQKRDLLISKLAATANEAEA